MILLNFQKKIKNMYKIKLLYNCEKYVKNIVEKMKKHKIFNKLIVFIAKNLNIIKIIKGNFKRI